MHLIFCNYGVEGGGSHQERWIDVWRSDRVEMKLKDHRNEEKLTLDQPYKNPNSKHPKPSPEIPKP